VRREAWYWGKGAKASSRMLANPLGPPADDRKFFLRRLASESKLAYEQRFPPMAAPSFQLDRHFGFIIADISRLARKEFDRRVREMRLTRAQWLFLCHLARQPGCTQSELAESLQMERISVSRQAERLEKAGWIKRRDRPEDARAYHLFMTPKAERLALRLEEVAGRLRDEYLSGLPSPRRERLINDLLQIKTNLLQMELRSKQRPDEN
jgi:MarR family transcriptional regulator for hemolysin